MLPRIVAFLLLLSAISASAANQNATPVVQKALEQGLFITPIPLPEQVASCTGQLSLPTAAQCMYQAFDSWQKKFTFGVNFANYWLTVAVDGYNIRLLRNGNLNQTYSGDISYGMLWWDGFTQDYTGTNQVTCCWRWTFVDCLNSQLKNKCDSTSYNQWLSFVTTSYRPLDYQKKWLCKDYSYDQRVNKCVVGATTTRRPGQTTKNGGPMTSQRPTSGQTTKAPGGGSSFLAPGFGVLFGFMTFFIATVML